MDIKFEVGQFCRISKLLNIEKKKGKVLANDKKLLNELNFDDNLNERILNFMESLDENSKNEFKHILKLLDK